MNRDEVELDEVERIARDTGMSYAAVVAMLEYDAIYEAIAASFEEDPR